MTYERWTSRIAEAGDPGDRRALLAEVATWRAQRLTDIAAAREATWAMSRLHAMLGEREAAVREARSLMSLCKTPPEASDEEVAAAEATLADLGEAVPRRERAKREKVERKRGKAKREAPEAPAAKGEAGARDRALAATARGDHGGALRALKGRRGPNWDLMRSWIQLNRALAAQTPEDRDADLRDLEARLRRLVTPRLEEVRKAAAAPAERQSLDDALSRLLGEPAHRRRERRITQMERWLEAHPDRVDDLASAALEHHVQVSGPRSPAPWLAGYAALALARDGQSTRQTVARLDKADTFAVTAYREGPFGRLVELLRAALRSGWGAAGLRRGVLARGEPADRRLWTLRLQRAGEERMVVVAPRSDAAYEGDLPRRLAERMVALCPASLLLAPGPGNEALREAAEAAGVRALAEDPGDEALLEQLSAVVAAAPPASAAPQQEPAKPAGPKPEEALAEALEQGLEPARLDEAVAAFPRAFRALQAASRMMAEAPDDAKVAAVLSAVDRAAPEGEAMPEGTSLAVRAAAAGGEQSASVLQEGPAAPRFGGPGIDVVLQLARELHADGWSAHRVLRGATRRERRAHPMLETLGDHLQGLWRLLVRRGEVRGEVWYVASLPPEGRAALPQLLLETRNRAVVLPIDPDLLAWYGTLSGPEAIGWTGEEGDALRGELSAWS